MRKFYDRRTRLIIGGKFLSLRSRRDRKSLRLRTSSREKWFDSLICTTAVNETLINGDFFMRGCKIVFFFLQRGLEKRESFYLFALVKSRCKMCGLIAFACD